MTRRPCFLIVVALFVCTSAGNARTQEPASARDTTKRAALAGNVRDITGHPIPQATIAVDDKSISAVTDDSGHFHLAGVPSGKNGFTITKIGFKPLEFETTLPPDSTILIDVRMHNVQELLAVNVTGVSERLARQGFYQRQHSGWGQYLSTQKVDSLQWVSTPAQMLRDVKGVVVRCRSAGRCSVQSTSGCLALFVNGAYTRGQLDDVLSTTEMYAVEVYSRSVEVPIEFHAPSAMGRCGALVVWTKAFSK